MEKVAEEQMEENGANPTFNDHLSDNCSLLAVFVPSDHNKQL